MKGFLLKHAGKLATGLVFAVLGAVLDANAKYIQGFLQNLLEKGGVSGPYVILVQGYKHSDADERETFQYTINLKQAGDTIFGTLLSVKDSTKSYDASGYTRGDFLSVSYKSHAADGHGTGAYTMKTYEDGNFKGFWAGVECKQGNLVLLVCPSIFYRSDKHIEPHYDSYISKPCQDVDTKSIPQKCD